jgi:hypothetical protein
MVALLRTHHGDAEDTGNRLRDGEGDGGGFRRSAFPCEKITAENLLRPPCFPPVNACGHGEQTQTGQLLR